jgi:hypothetical protein
MRCDDDIGDAITTKLIRDLGMSSSNEKTIYLAHNMAKKRFDPAEQN